MKDTTTRHPMLMLQPSGRLDRWLSLTLQELLGEACLKLVGSGQRVLFVART